MGGWVGAPLPSADPGKVSQTYVQDQRNFPNGQQKITHIDHGGGANRNCGKTALFAEQNPKTAVLVARWKEKRE